MTNLLVLMLFAHIVDDFYLQGLLKNLKMRSWWQDQIKDRDLEDTKYKDDYLVALLVHGLSWSIMIQLPAYFLFGMSFNLFLLVVNMFAHAIIDNRKCNTYELNLVQDQGLHLIQIVPTWMYFVFA